MTSTTTMTILKEDVFQIVNPPRHGIAVLRAKTTLFVKDDSVSIVTSEYICGGSKSGKPWYRWRDVTGIYLSYRARGNGPVRLNMYKKDMRKMDGGRNITTFRNETARRVSLFPFDHDASVTLAVLDLLFRKNLITQDEKDEASDPFPYGRLHSTKAERLIVRSAYPATKLFNETYRVPSGITLAAREHTMQDLVRVAFGKKRYRKDLVKACADSSMKRIAQAHALRLHVPVDWVVELLRRKISDHTVHDVHPYINEVLKAVPMGRRRTFFFSAARVSTWEVEDTKNMIENNSLHHVIQESRDFHDLHSRLIIEIRKLTTLNQDVVITSIAEKYHKTETAGGLLIVAPEETETIHSWGDRMHNCIGSYADRARTGRVFLGGVYSDNGLVANFEISEDGKLKQLLGKYNENLTQDVQTDILDTLVNVKAIHVDKKTKTIPQAWGVTNYVPITERETITQ